LKTTHTLSAQKYTPSSTKAVPLQTEASTFPPHRQRHTAKKTPNATTTAPTLKEKSNKENVAHHWQQQHPNYHRTTRSRPTKTNKPPSDQPTIMHGLLVWVYLLATTATAVGQTLQTHCPIPSQHNIAILMHKRFKVLHGRNELLGLLENRPSLWQNDIQALAHWKELTKEEKADHNKENDRVWWMEEFEERFVQYYGSKLCQGLFGVVAALEGKDEQPSGRTMSKEGEL
jgi:hypothetical protein